MTEAQMIEWINTASYEQLFRKWRFAPPGNPFFTGKVGDHFVQIMSKRREEVGSAEHTATSKRIGWER